MVSKHLAVLTKVGLVHERREGRQRLYRVDWEKLNPSTPGSRPLSATGARVSTAWTKVLDDIQKKEQ